MYLFLKKLRPSLIILSILVNLTEVKTQDKAWDNDPKAYVQSRAVQASADQTLIQDSLNQEKKVLAGLETSLARTVQSSKITALKAQIKSSKQRTRELQSRLTEKIMEGKTYKEMMSLTDQEIRHRLTSSDHSISSITSRGDSIGKNNTTDNPGQPQDKPPVKDVVKPKAEAVVQTEKNISQRLDPWTGVGHPGQLINVPCQYQDSPAGSSRKSGVALEPEVLFRYTPDEIKKYLRGQSYVTGEAFIATEPGFVYLQLRLDIASDQALRHYGNLEKSILVVYFVNGKELKLINSRFDAGFVDNYKKNTAMTGVYYLEKPMVKLLMSSEVDKIRLNFATGYEDYTVYNVDFFTRQLACIQASK